MSNQCSGCLDIVKTQFLPPLDTILSLYSSSTWPPWLPKVFNCGILQTKSFHASKFTLSSPSLLIVQLHIVLISVFNQITVQEVKWLIAPLEEHYILKVDKFLIGRIQKPSQNKLFFLEEFKSKGAQLSL